MKRIYNFKIGLRKSEKTCYEIILIECWSFLIVPIGEMLPKIHCKEYGIALIWEWIW